MFMLDSQERLLQAFRPRDRGEVELPADLTFPHYVRSYLAWPHPAGGKVFLVFAVPHGAPTGIVFHTTGGSPAVAELCDWCHSPGTGTEVGLLTTRVNADRTIGVHLCSDLGCGRKLDAEANRKGISVLPAMHALLERMGQFAQEGLSISPDPAHR